MGANLKTNRSSLRAFVLWGVCLSLVLLTPDLSAMPAPGQAPLCDATFSDRDLVAMAAPSRVTGSAQTTTHNPTESDAVTTSTGVLTITPIIHASLMLEFCGRTIHVDPTGDYSGMRKADLILITDTHGDHFGPLTVADLYKEATVIVAPEAVARRIATGAAGGDAVVIDRRENEAATIEDVQVLANGDSIRVDLQGVDIGIEAVAAYNLQTGPQARLMHPRGRGNGYVLTFADTRVFVSGDTECVPEIRQLQDIDIAFLPADPFSTMTAPASAECVKAFGPATVYPYHYISQDLQGFVDALSSEDVEVRLRSWYR
jgi:L-ascorbate metabolism protein UlaG (beta-lactamase superfamily)